MNDLSQKKLALFFTRGISLKIWSDTGNLSRELKIYLELKKYFSEIIFFTYGDKDDENYLKNYVGSIKVFPKKNNFPNWLHSLLIPWLYRNELRGIDIYKTNQMDGSWSAILAKIMFGKKLLVRCGYEWYRFVCYQKKKWWYRYAVFLIEYIGYKMADKISITSAYDRKFIISVFRVDDKKISLIPNYVETDSFAPLAVKRDQHKIIFVGRLNKQKNLINLIEAMVGLDATLYIYGEGEDRKKIEKIIVEQNITNIVLKGKIKNEDLPSELNSATIFILPSLYEGNPKTLLEAMSCGLAVVGTKVNGIKEIIEHGKNGFLCDCDSDSIRDTLIEVLADRMAAAAAGEQARKYILGGFSLSSVINKELVIYKQL